MQSLKHVLLQTFYQRLSYILFEDDQNDLDALIAAKAKELRCSKEDAKTKLTKRELKLHVRRRTRHHKVIEREVEHLLTQFTSDLATDGNGVPLFKKTEVWAEWDKQKKHIQCLCDPVFPVEKDADGKDTQFSLHQELKKKQYRCPRGSSSLESFHCNIYRFIPGTSANMLHCHAYLMEKLL